MIKKYRVGIVGATGYVGQRFLTLLEHHPFFRVVRLAASERSAGLPYEQAVQGRWKLLEPIPESVCNLKVESARLWAQPETPLDLDLIFCAIDLSKEEIRALEEAYAQKEIVVVSNNSAQRWVPDVPMIIPEVNINHLQLLEEQKKRLQTRRGCIVCKPNCSIQAYVSALSALAKWEPTHVMVSTYQAVSGAGKMLTIWPEMQENVIPYIGGEEEKSEQEPLKIWGRLQNAHIECSVQPLISAQCYRVPVQEGHLASVSVQFKHPVTEQEILQAWSEAKPCSEFIAHLPSAPQNWLLYHTETDRPQPKRDASTDLGMSIHLGRLRKDPIWDFKFTCLAHNTIRGAAGGAILTAECMEALGYLSE